MKEYGVNYASNFWLESYWGAIYKSVNKRLRGAKGAPNN